MIRPKPACTGLGRRRLLRYAALGGAGLLLPVAQSYRVHAGTEPLRLGFVGPFSGPTRDTGLEIRQGVLMALADARDEGELPLNMAGDQRGGPAGMQAALLREIVPIWIDTESNPDRAVAAVTRALTRDRVSMLVGGWHSDTALALMDAESAYDVVHLGHLGEAQAIADRISQSYGKYRGWFKGWPSPAMLAARYAAPLEYLRVQGLWRPSGNRAAIMAENTAYGRGWGEALRAGLQGTGFSVATPDLTAIDSTDFRSLLEHYRDTDVSLVAVTTTGTQAAAAFVRQFREVGVRALLLGHGLRWNRDWHGMTGEASDYVLAMDTAMPIALWQQWWVRRYQRRYGGMPSIAAAGFHYDYTRMAIRVLNASASLARDDIIRTIYRLPYRGVWNRYEFAREAVPGAMSPNEVQAGPFMEGFFFPMAQLLDGKANIIWPPRYADRRFMAPPWLRTT